MGVKIWKCYRVINPLQLKFRHLSGSTYFLTGTYSAGAVLVAKHNSAKRIVRQSAEQYAAQSTACEAIWKRSVRLQSVKALTKGSHFFLFGLFSSK